MSLVEERYSLWFLLDPQVRRIWRGDAPQKKPIWKKKGKNNKIKKIDKNHHNAVYKLSKWVFEVRTAPPQH